MPRCRNAALQGSNEGSNEECNVDAPIAALVPLPSGDAAASVEFKAGDQILYRHRELGKCTGQVIKVHTDDAVRGMYYTIEYSRDDTTVVEAPDDKGKMSLLDIKELNTLLARARKNQNHKESLRLLKLQPTLVPKPVVSSNVQKPVLEKANPKESAFAAPPLPSSKVFLEVIPVSIEKCINPIHLSVYILFKGSKVISRAEYLAAAIALARSYTVHDALVSSPTCILDFCYTDPVINCALPHDVQAFLSRSFIALLKSDNDIIVVAALSKLCDLLHGDTIPEFCHVSSDFRKAITAATLELGQMVGSQGGRSRVETLWICC